MKEAEGYKKEFNNNFIMCQEPDGHESFKKMVENEEKSSEIDT